MGIDLSFESQRLMRFVREREQRTQNAGRLFAEAAVIAEALRTIVGIVDLVWTLLLLAVGLGGIVPPWAVIVAAVFGFPSLHAGVKRPAVARQREAYEEEARVLELDEAIENCRERFRAHSSGSTSEDMGPSRN